MRSFLWVKKMAEDVDTRVKYFTNTNFGAPQLTNNWGVLINVLDAVLVNGLALPDVASTFISDDIATMTFMSQHKISAFQVISLTGATLVNANREYRVLSVTDHAITFKVDQNVKEINGPIVVKLAPLGYNKLFSGEQKAAYQSKNILKNGCILRVDNAKDSAYGTTYAKFAKVGVMLRMNDIDDISSHQTPFDASNPNRNWVGTGSGVNSNVGWAKWYYAKSEANTITSVDSDAPLAGNRDYLIVGNDEGFWFSPSMSTPSQEDNNYALLNGFGVLDGGVTEDVFLSATLSTQGITSGNAEQKATITPSSSTDVRKLCLLKNNAGGLVSSTNNYVVGLFCNASAMSSGAANNYSAANIIISDTYCIDGGAAMRGKMPILKWIYQARPYTNMSLVAEQGRVFLIKSVMGATNTTLGQVAFELGGV